jgi:hypothetical protein
LASRFFRVTRGPIALAAALLLLAPRSHAQDPTRVVIRRAQIEAAGWFNLGEILTGATGWLRTTLDGLSFFASTDGLPPGARAPGEQEWVVLVDGQRVTVDALGAKVLELMPISPGQVESVTVTRVPRLVAGTLAARGVVEFHTRRPPRGPAANGAWHSGNVTGDPGPYQFTPLGAENVDRLGPYNYALGSFAGAGWDVTAGARQGSSHITHRGIRERFDPALYEQLGVHKWAPYDVVHARIGAALLGGLHGLVGGRGWVNGPLFLPQVGGEQWLRGTFEHVGAAGSALAGPATLGYQVTHSGLDLAELPTPFPFVAGHSRHRTAGLLELQVSSGTGGRVLLGAGATRWAMDRAGVSGARTEATLFASLTSGIGRATNQLSGALTRSTGGPLAGKAVLSTRVSPDSATSLSAALSYVQHVFGEDGTWIDRAILGLDTLTRERDANAWVDLGATRRLAPNLSADLGVRAGMLNGARLLTADGQPIAGASSARVAEVRAGLSLPPTARVPVARLTYRYATTLGGDDAVREALRATPAHALEASLVTAPTRDLRFGAFLDLASRATWGPFRGAATAPVTLPALSRLDLSAEKWFWRRRLRTQFLFRNVLDRPERYHPLGAIFPLRAHLTFEVALPGGA